MNKEIFIEKIKNALEERNIPHRNNFESVAFVNPHDNNDGELTINGAQIEQTKINYKFYNIDVQKLQKESRQTIIKEIKSQYPGIIFFFCGSEENASKTIDFENNFIVIENENFCTAVDLCGDINAYIKTLL